MNWLNNDLQKLGGVGTITELKLNQLGIYSLSDLLFHLPKRYKDQTKISSLSTQVLENDILVEGVVESIESNYFAKGSVIIKLHSTNCNNQFQIQFFKFSQKQKYAISRGSLIQVFGTLKLTNKNKYQFFHPEYKILSNNHKPLLTNKLTPIYKTITGISQYQITTLIKYALAKLEKNPLIDFLTKGGFDGNWHISKCLAFIHNPDNTQDVDKIINFRHIAYKHLIIEEFCAYRLTLYFIRQKKQNNNAKVFLDDFSLIEKFKKTLKFNLTNAQNKVIQQINADLAKSKPMLRLLQGDVGCGKTIVALIVALKVVANKYQVAYMAPTQVLAEQIFITFKNYLGQLNITIAYLSGSQKKSEYKNNLLLIKNGLADIVIGTHSLFQENVEFKKLALVIIDEQHRFGVGQRLKLSQKTAFAHQLVMTATPIPRSLYMTFYADLDLSVIDKFPDSKKNIETVVIKSERRDEVISKIKDFCNDNKQVYWVCPLIEDSEKLQLESVEQTLKNLKTNLSHLKIRAIHGKLTSDEKTTIMSEFKDGKFNILVATTIIEVGIDVANASLIIIENAERLGLSQLHQLRGRVGRGGFKGFCILMYNTPLTPKAKQRLKAMRDSQDGFYISKQDLIIRGPGEVLGTRQTGIIQFKIADIVRDSKFLMESEKYFNYLKKLPKEHQEILVNRWIDSVNKTYSDA